MIYSNSKKWEGKCQAQPANPQCSPKGIREGGWDGDKCLFLLLRFK